MDKEYYEAIAKEKNIESILDLGLAYEDDGDHKAAEACYLIAIDKGDLNAQYNLGLLYWNLEYDAEAKKCWIAAAEKGEVNSIHNLGSLAMQEEDFDTVERYWTLAAEKGNQASKKGLAYLYHLTNRFEASEACYLELLKATENDGDLLKELGDLYLKYNFLEKAQSRYTQATNHGNVDAWYNLGYLYEEEGLLEDAKASYHQGVLQGNLECRFPLGNLYEEGEEYEAAIEVWKEAALDGDLMSANFLGWLYVRMGYVEVAEDYFLMLEAGGDKEYSLGHVYFILKKWDLAAHHFNSALPLLDQESGFYSQTLASLSYIYFIQNKQPEEALQYIEEACQIHPNVRFFLFKGLFLLWQNHLDEALAIAADFWYDEGTLQFGLEELSDFLLLLLAKQEYQLVSNYFTSKEGAALGLATNEALQTIYGIALDHLTGNKEEQAVGEAAQVTEEKDTYERIHFFRAYYCA